jgi:uncharacterized protein YaeQ
MALGATIYTFDIALADLDRDVTQTLDLRVAQHPSESPEHFLMRVLAYCFEFEEGIAFSNGLFEPDQPAIAIRDLTGALRVWVDVGTPEPARLHRAAKSAPRVVVYTHKEPGSWLARLAGERIHRREALELHAIDRDWLAALVGKLERRMRLSLTISDGHVYLSIGEETLASEILRLQVP